MKLLIKIISILVAILQSNFSLSQEPTDCVNPIIVCGNSNINLEVNGIGVQELGFGENCSSQENNSLWLKVTLVTDGTLGFTLTPSSTAITEDYDFFVFGPNVTCDNIGQSIRCSTTNPQQANQGNNLTGMNSSSNDTFEGPGSDGNSFVKWLDVLAGETYYIVIDRPIGNSAFNLEWTGSAQFSDPPTNESITAGIPLDIENCDITYPFTDGFTDFNLTDNTPHIIGAQNNVTVTYHTSINNANIGTEELTSPYTNIVNPQTIYARITNNTTGCYELTEFELSSKLGPDFAEPSDYIKCDDSNDGNSRNGRTIFNLSEKNSEILNGQNPANLDITYYNSLANAETKNAPLPNSYYNNLAFNETVYVRIENTNNPDCKNITTLNLVVHPQPEAYNHSILQCDEDGLVDGFTSFNLNQANENLTGGVIGISTKFYTDAARTQQVSGNAFNNTVNPQTIYVELIDNQTGCTSFSELVLEVSTTDVNDATLTPVCDDDGIEDGFHVFNLNDANSLVITGIPIAGLTISYYETYDDALLEQNPLNPSYTNTVAYNQTIFARVENQNNCYGISEITLTVNPLPDIITNDLEYYCLNIFPVTIPINAGMLNDLPSNYSYSWSTGENLYEIQINETGTFTVTVTNANGCSKERTVAVEPSNLATIESINIVDVVENNTISVLVSGEGEYLYQLVDSNNTITTPYQESNVFENVTPGLYTVYVRDIKNNCGTVNSMVSVIGFPKFFTPNNDGINDTWQVYGVSEMFQPDTKILIFNRFGKLIKELNPIGDGWDGTFNGTKLPTDDYWFSVKLQDGRLFKNHFTLKN